MPNPPTAPKSSEKPISRTKPQEVDITTLANSRGYAAQEAAKYNNHVRQREWALFMILGVILIFAMSMVVFGNKESQSWGLQFIAMIGSGVGGAIVGQKIGIDAGDRKQ
jgi:hypothetical protein